MKNKKGEIATLLTLGLVLIGAIITMASSFFVKNNRIAYNSRASPKTESPPPVPSPIVTPMGIRDSAPSLIPSMNPAPTVGSQDDTIVGEGQSCCFQKKGKIYVYSTYDSMVANEMPLDCKRQEAGINKSYGPIEIPPGAFVCEGAAYTGMDSNEYHQTYDAPTPMPTEEADFTPELSLCEVNGGVCVANRTPCNSNQATDEEKNSCKETYPQKPKCCRQSGSLTPGLEATQSPLYTPTPTLTPSPDTEDLFRSCSSRSPTDNCSAGLTKIEAIYGGTTNITYYYCCPSNTVNTIKSRCSLMERANNFQCTDELRVFVDEMQTPTAVPEGTCDVKSTVINYNSNQCSLSITDEGSYPCGKDYIILNNDIGCVIYRICPSSGNTCKYECYQNNKKYNCLGANDPNANHDVIHIVNNTSQILTIISAEVRKHRVGSEIPKILTKPDDPLEINPGESYTYDLNNLDFTCDAVSFNSMEAIINEYKVGDTFGPVLTGSDGCGGGVKILFNITE
ncbi:MAG: hypothetical protein US40_C0004G0026 [Candidatus Roizmanbacteria bacterium GW2011_GWC2_37_13]|uniref:Uncharacterized protein n=1 Tax=Candidatus Roizmanbacteria bacterium GW2011_GWC2_37_13 TaxID=1618486 RepID=A0A0G0JCU1_9BACT|nr:MAG: hypothetical protein US38_C0001G0013 [Candidatus Roizmanbacteria bacterium GW2011_GWC1_37_12]KKQ25991.1 MAG: hypothetical protein US40_C0004G0026 [Candidatus Roizmanbacteria bacterium GW2011_GWC2_37_13]